MRELEIARRLSALNQPESACKAYKLVLEQNGGRDTDIDMEAAAYILQYGAGEDYKIAYTVFRGLYNQGIMKNSVLGIMRAAFYEPNLKLLKSRYEKNCKLLAKYPYLFRKDFLEFDKLPIQFFPYDDNSYTPFYPKEECFGDYIEPKNQIISRNFFGDLENPILADNVFSQYELEYLRDNVRRSEDIGRENHVYLHYTNWGEFCSYLQCLNMKPLLEEKKLVFLIEEEICQYPIDFQERFGIDYSKYPVRPLGIRDIHRMIWATQLSSHNGGDFFNEIFDDHPNLIAMPSVIFKTLEETIAEAEQVLSAAHNSREVLAAFSNWENPNLGLELYQLKDRTSKDILVALYFREMKSTSPHLDTRARIAPALFFQPHFYNIIYHLEIDDKGRAMLCSAQQEQIQKSSIFSNFKYIKTFTPMRRITTSYAASVRFMRDYEREVEEKESSKPESVASDAITERVLNRSFMFDWQNRLYKDCRLVRFEDGKLNPRATFTALARFVDLPYTESMTYCSLFGERDPESLKGNDRGFDPAAIYRTYDNYANEAERAYIEYFMRDAYSYYGYDFMYHDGTPMEEAEACNLLDGFTTLDGHIRESWTAALMRTAETILRDKGTPEEDLAEAIDQMAVGLMDQQMEKIWENRRDVTRKLLSVRRFINREGQPLQMMPKLELDPALLERPLYH